MRNMGENREEYTVIMDAEAMNAGVIKLAREIVEANPDLDNVVLVGIQSRGKPLAERLSRKIAQMTGKTLPVGTVSAAFYRDDIGSGAGGAKARGETYFDFSLEGKVVLLVDDVLASGRTVRAAMGELMDYGRPKRIQLACLIDRGCRELPIRADFLGWPIATQPQDWVRVRFTEIDGEDVVLHTRGSMGVPPMIPTPMGGTPMLQGGQD